MWVLVTFKGKAGRKTQERGGEANEGGRKKVERRERCKSIKQNILFRWESSKRTHSFLLAASES